MRAAEPYQVEANIKIPTCHDRRLGKNEMLQESLNSWLLLSPGRKATAPKIGNDRTGDTAGGPETGGNQGSAVDGNAEALCSRNTDNERYHESRRSG
jgi:hypothetical protein